jgi:hypothetical protein
VRQPGPRLSARIAAAPSLVAWTPWDTGGCHVFTGVNAAAVFARCYACPLKPVRRAGSPGPPAASAGWSRSMSTRRIGAARRGGRAPGGGRARARRRQAEGWVEPCAVLPDRPTFRAPIVGQKFVSSTGKLGKYGGEGGIRTHGRLAPTSVFETDAIDHSATSPWPGAGYKGSGAGVQRPCRRPMPDLRSGRIVPLTPPAGPRYKPRLPTVPLASPAALHGRYFHRTLPGRCRLGT